VTENVLLVAGLPGCGKTTYLDELQGDGWLIFDDFKAGAINNSSRFRMSRHFAVLLAHLRDGVRCVVADIDFCKTESCAEAECALRAEVPGVGIGWCYFLDEERVCEANIIRRNRPSLRADLAKLHEYSSYYRIPRGAAVRPCYRPPQGADSVQISG